MFFKFYIVWARRPEKKTSLKSLVQDYGDIGMLQVQRLSTLALASKAAISHLSLCWN